MAKNAVSAAEKAGKEISSDSSSKTMRNSVWQEMRTVREGASFASSGRWESASKTSGTKLGGQKK